MSSQHGPMTFRFDRAAMFALLVVGLLLLPGRFFFISGITEPVLITGGSMAETLLGEHFTHRCAHCRRTQFFDANVPLSRATCVQCGRESELPNEPQLELGERVLLDRGAYLTAGPARGEIVAFRDAAGSLSVKRTAALPGEMWEIRSGDLWINGDIVRKSNAEAARQAVCVASRSTDAADAQSNSLELQARWVKFHPTPALPFVEKKKDVLRDFDAYNPVLPRALFPVSDCWFKIQAKAGISSQLTLTHENGSTRALAKLDFAANSGSFEIRGEGLKQQERFTLAGMRSTAEIIWGRCDARYFLILNGHRLLSHAIKPESHSVPGSTQPLSLESIADLPPLSVHVERDQHLLAPNNLSDSWKPSAPLGPNEYALLGDNGPISIDSRQLGPVKRSAIMGKVMRFGKRPSE